MIRKTVLRTLCAIGITLLMAGCSLSNSNSNNSGDVPHFSSLNVYYGSEDITSKADQEKIEQIVYAVITDDKFFEGGLDQMAWELVPDKIPEGKIQISADYDSPVLIESTEISNILITPDNVHEDSYFFVANACTFASDETIKQLTEACGL